MHSNKKIFIIISVAVAIIIVIVLATIFLKQTSTKTKNIIGPTAQTSNGEITESLQLTIKPDKSVYKKGELILIPGQIRNLSEQGLYFYTTDSSLTVTFDIIDPRGGKVEAAVPISDPGLPELKEFALIGPGGSLSKGFEVVIPEEHLKSSGVYTISATYKVFQDWYYDYANNKRVTLDAWTGTLKSNAIKIEIQ